mmetsp:Transcript_7370/g.10862  ORF Transcript_7370/g.10862 Transcript_7370/m.10862 type:complete len:382 (-) Transcript_7370:1328-2473(-)
MKNTSKNNAEGSGHGEARSSQIEEKTENLNESINSSYESLDKLLGNVKGEISTIRRKLEMERIALEKEREKFEKEREEFERKKREMKELNKINDESIVLNVGGERFETTLKTLRQKKETMFDTMFSGYFQISKTDEGEVFIDRDPKHFRKILNYLSDGTLLYNSEDKLEMTELMLEMEYYNIPIPFSNGNLVSHKIEEKRILDDGLILHVYSNFKKNEVVFEIENTTQKTCIVQLEWEKLENLSEPTYYSDSGPLLFLYVKEKQKYCSFSVLDYSKQSEYQYRIHSNTSFHEKRIEHTPLDKFNVIVESYKFDLMLILLVRNIGDAEQTFRVDWTMLSNMTAPIEPTQKKIDGHGYIVYSKLAITDINMAWRYKWKCFINR